MFCKKCGKEIDENLEFCPHCGAPVSKPKKVAPPADSAHDAAKPAAEPNNKPQSENKNTNVYALIGFVLSICTWVIFSWLNYRVYICTAIGAASLALSIVAFIFAEKKNYNFKSLAIAGIIISVVAVIFWPLYTL